MSAPTPTPQQVRAARALLGWSQQKLAGEAQIALSTLADFEAGRRTPVQNNMKAIVTALVDAGVAFTNGDEPGVKLRKQEG